MDDILSRPKPKFEEEEIPPQKKEAPKVVFDTSAVPDDDVNSSKFDHSKNNMSKGFKIMMEEDDQEDRMKKARDLASMYKKDTKKSLFDDEEDKPQPKKITPNKPKGVMFGDEEEVIKTT